MRFVSNNEEMSLLRTLPVIAFFSTKTLDEEIWARALVGDSVLLSSAIAAGMFKGRCVGGHNIRVEIPGPLLGYELRKSSSTCAGHGPVCLSTLQLVALRMNVTAGEFKLKSESPPEYSGREMLLRSSRACSDIARSVYEIAKAAGISPKAGRESPVGSRSANPVHIGWV